MTWRNGLTARPGAMQAGREAGERCSAEHREENARLNSPRPVPVSMLQGRISEVAPHFVIREGDDLVWRVVHVTRTRKPRAARREHHMYQQKRNQTGGHCRGWCRHAVSVASHVAESVANLL